MSTQAATDGASPALDVNDLGVSYYTSSGEIKAADGVSFSIMPGKRMGLVGESGSGKTTTALALMRLIKPPGRITKGTAVIDGTDLLSLDDEEMRNAKVVDHRPRSTGRDELAEPGRQSEKPNHRRPARP